jgi:hypothetical protein
LNPAKGCVFTEAGARWFAPRPSNGEPVEVIRWLESRKSEGKYLPGVYLCWELMAGNSNCRWYWGAPENTPEPTIPWCGLLWPDASPVSLAEAEAVRHYATGETQALFFDDFQSGKTTGSPRKEAQWTVYEGVSSGVCHVEPGVKRIAGDESWTDHVLEGCVMLTNSHSNAGLMFRVNDAGNGRDGKFAADDYTGYFTGFDTKTLYLGKMNNGEWKLLAQYPLEKLECKVIPGVWNQIRVAVEGSQIRVWFNRMHPSADPENGLRITYNDTDSPILKGNIGMRAIGQSAMFDNIIVLPISILE